MLNYTRNFLKRSNTHSKTKSNTLEKAAGYRHLNRHSLGHCEEPFAEFTLRYRRAQDFVVSSVERQTPWQSNPKKTRSLRWDLGYPRSPDPVGGGIKREGSWRTEYWIGGFIWEAFI